MAYIDFWDYLLLPFYILLALKVLLVFAKEKYGYNIDLKNYFIKGAIAKLIGALFISIIYAYYYGAGDNFDYFYHIKLVTQSLQYGVETWWNIFTLNPNPSSEIENSIIKQFFYFATDTKTVWQISSLLSPFAFNKYLPLTIIIATISFSGNWLIFLFFQKQFPQFTRHFAYACFYVPTLALWTSGLFKDTFCITGIGWLLWGTYNIFINNQWKKLKYYVLSILGFIILLKIKAYILAILLPSLFLYVIAVKISKLSPTKAIFFTASTCIILIALSPYIIQTIESQSKKYVFENLSNNINNSRNYFLKLAENDNSSVFDIGDLELTPSGVINILPKALVTGLYRPYLWEVRKPIVLFAALESAFFLLLTIHCIAQIIKRKNYKDLLHPVILLSLSFTLVFIFIITTSTSNFGSLSRYKTAAIPFFLCALIILSNGINNKAIKQSINTKGS